MLDNLRETDSIRRTLSQIESLENDKEALQHRVLQLESEKHQIQAELDDERRSGYSAMQMQLFTMLKGVESQLVDIKSDMNEGFVRAEKKVDGLGKKIDQGVGDIKDTLHIIQEQVASLKEFAETSLLHTIEQERIKFEQECADENKVQEELLLQLSQKINETLEAKTKNMNELLVEEEAYLKGLFGDIWGKLKDDTQSSLKSARVLWRGCAEITDKTFDYSGICISLTAALENEVKRVFFFGFQNYMQRKYGKPHINPQEWPQDLIYSSNNGSIYKNNGNNITLGSIPYLLCVKGQTGTEDFKVLKEKMTDYLKSIMTGEPRDPFLSFEEGENSSFISLCDKITTEYRNPAAHTGKINQKTMEDCHRAIIGKMKASEDIGQITSLILKLYEYVDINKIPN